MIRSNQKFFNILHVLSDALFIFASFHLAYFYRFHYYYAVDTTLPYEVYCLVAVIAMFIQISVYGCLGMYQSQRRVHFRQTFLKITIGNIISCGILLMGLYFLKYNDISRFTLGLFFLIEQVVITIKRYSLQKILYHFRKQGYNQKHVIIIGTGVLAQRYVNEIKKMPELGYHISGYISRKESFTPLRYLGNYDNMLRILERMNPDEVVVALSPEEYMQTKAIIYACEKAGIRMSMIPYYTQFFPASPQVDHLGELPMLHLRPMPLEHFGYRLLKRCFDICGSLCLLIVLSPLLLLLWIATKCSGVGPAIFKQVRVGKNRKKFTMYKFTTMKQGEEADTTWSCDHDPRKTKLGAVLRKCSLDELPQLWNVLKGDMSLVGPRPELPYFVKQFKEEIPRYMVKHQVRPGMTGWAQVCGFRGDTSIPQRIDHDLYYIEHWSLFLDVKILIQTLFLGMVNNESLQRKTNEVTIYEQQPVEK